MNRKFLAASFLTTLTLVLTQHPLKAVPFASCITNDFTGNNVFYYLNEDAPSVKFIVGTTTNDLGAQSRGLHSVAVSGPTSYQFLVTKSSAVTWTRIADHALGGTNANPLMLFYSPGGIAPYRNPQNLSHFGRIYILENAGGATVTTPPRTTQEGVYVLNADRSDALGQGVTALNGGLSWVSGNAAASDGVKSPWKIEVGEDGYLYIADFSTNNGGIFRVDPDVTTGETVLASPGRSANPTVHTDCNGSAIAKGSIAGGNLQIWAIDGAWSPGGFNQLVRWDINGSALPFNSPPTALGSAGVPGSPDLQSDLDIATDGKFFISQVRAAGPGAYNPDNVGIKVLSADATTVLWDSLAQSTNALNNANAIDIFTNIFSIKVSPDGTKMAAIRTDTQTWIVGLTNGVPNIATRVLINTFNGTSTSTAANRRREVAFDAAGNLYAGNNSQERMVVWSPGGTTTTVTTFDNTTGEGSFQVIVPPNIVSITNSTPTTIEASVTPGRFTVSRAGDTTGVLTVNYAISGTATNGVDYVTLPGSVTFLSGASSTNINVTTIDDGNAELTETVVLTVTGNNIAYDIGSPATATVAIIDEDPATLTLAGTQPVLIERFASNRATVTITRLGLTNAAMTANLSYSGDAVFGADYSGPATIALASGAVTAAVNLAPLDDQLSEGVETAGVTIVSNGLSYVVGSSSSVTVSIVDDDVLSGVVLFADPFDHADTSTNWIVNPFNPDAFADFGFDYSSVGIPEAPSSSGVFAARRGLKFRVNETDAIITGLSVSPLNGDFNGDYRLRFDLWMNYAGPLNNANVPGQTQTANAGVGSSGYTPVIATAGDCVWFTANGDAGSAAVAGDYNAYSINGLYADNSGVYAAGTNAGVRDNFSPYYAVWNAVGAPPAQITIKSTQTGLAQAGGIGMAWHKWDITKRGTNVTWDVDGRRFATVDISALTLSTNVTIGYHDPFASVTTNSLVQFGLFDNVRVETLSRPLITGIQFINLGTQVQLDFTAETGDTADLFEVRSATQVSAVYNFVPANITSLGGNKFRAVTVAGPQELFFLIKRL